MEQKAKTQDAGRDNFVRGACRRNRIKSKCHESVHDGPGVLAWQRRSYGVEIVNCNPLRVNRFVWAKYNG